MKHGISIGVAGVLVYLLGELVMMTNAFVISF